MEIGIDRNKINREIAAELDGKLFVYIWMVLIGKSYSVQKSYYTVLDGIVYCVDNGIKDKSGDEPIHLKTRCIQVGKYNPNKVYKRVIKDYTYADIKKLFKF